MIISLLIILLIISFIVHIYFLIQYIGTKKKKFLTLYLNTTVSNMLIAGGLIYVSLKNPLQIREVDLKTLFWLISGIVLAVTLNVKISIFRNIYRRAQEPENYHFNFFGKKVLHATVVKPIYLFGFFGSMPFFLVAGSYFVARLINLILYRHL